MASTLLPSRKKSEILYLGNFSATSIDITQYYDDYTSLTVDNFFLVPTSVSGIRGGHGGGTEVASSGSYTVSRSYDSENGTYVISLSTNFMLNGSYTGTGAWVALFIYYDLYIVI